MDSRNTGDDDRQPTDATGSHGSSADVDPPSRGGSGDGVVIPVNFGAGMTRRGDAPSPGAEPDQSADIDGDPLFEDLVIELTARQRRFVEVAAWTLADDVYDAIEELHRRPESASHSSSILSDFPPVTWTQSEAWWREQARCFDDLALEAQAGLHRGGDGAAPNSRSSTGNGHRRVRSPYGFGRRHRRARQR
jgi:hypothetical protein